MDKETLKQIIREILEQEQGSGPVLVSRLPDITVSEQDRFQTGDPSHVVYTRDLFTLEQSPRLGCGIMEMEHTTFPWTLQYDEVDYVISGTLTVNCCGKSVTAGPGELILIPKGSHIRFSVPEKARFLYVTYPADWQNQK